MQQDLMPGLGTTSGGLYKLASDGTLQWEKTLAKGNGYSFFTDVIQKADGSFDTTPNPDAELHPGDILIAVGTAEELRQLEELFARSEAVAG